MRTRATCIFVRSASSGGARLNVENINASVALATPAAKRAAIGLAHAVAVGVGGDHLEGVAGGHEAVHAAGDVQGAVAAAATAARRS